MIDTGPVVPDLISVILPTHRRPHQARAAALSALNQTYANTEVIAVSDGPDPATRDALAGLHPRLRYFELPENKGPAAARNFGVTQSRGEWLTFLDDDDLMLPNRLNRQITQVDRNQPHRISACRIVYQHAGRKDIWPARPIRPGEDLGDYLLVRPSLLGRPGVLSLQSLLIHHSLLREAPLTNHADHEDWAWMLDAWHLAGARVTFLWEPLVIYNVDTEAESRSRRTNWQDSLHWAQKYRSWLTPRAFNSFLSTKVAIKARRANSREGLRRIFNILQNNKPSLLDRIFFASIFLLPNTITQSLWKHSLNNRHPIPSKP